MAAQKASTNNVPQQHGTEFAGIFKVLKSRSMQYCWNTMSTLQNMFEIQLRRKAYAYRRIKAAEEYFYE